MKRSRARGVLMACIVVILCMMWGGIVLAAHPEDLHQWSTEELQTLKGLWLGSLPPLPPSSSNAYADSPQAAALGKKLFFDVRFSGNEKVSCGTCHQPDLVFTDALPVAHGMGFTARRTMPMLALGYQTWLFWDGRKDSLWAQALGPLESPVEHGFTRTMCFQVIESHYRDQYESVFGPLPQGERLRPAGRPAMDNVEALKDWVRMTPQMRESVNRVYANMGKAIGAYVRTIMPGPSRFDRYVEAALKGDRPAMEAAMNTEEALGLRTFITSGGCINCHNGPMFTNGSFHNVGVKDKDKYDRGRADGIIGVLADEFNCLGKYSDAVPSDCAPLKFIDTDTDKYVGAFKTPTLRNVADRPPYMHAGQFATLHSVLTHYQRIAKEREGATGEDKSVIHGELTDADVEHLEAFLRTLSGPIVETKAGE